MNILVTGGKGQLGNELRSCLESMAAEIGPIDRLYACLLYTSRVVYPSSRLVYAEKKRSSITETDRKDPKSVYAITKLAAEHYIKLYANCFGTKYCILRMCTPFGTLIDGAQSYEMCIRDRDIIKPI